MAERPEDLNLPNSVVSKIIKEAVCNLTRVMLCISAVFAVHSSRLSVLI